MKKPARGGGLVRKVGEWEIARLDSDLPCGNLNGNRLDYGEGKFAPTLDDLSFDLGPNSIVSGGVQVIMSIRSESLQNDMPSRVAKPAIYIAFGKSSIQKELLVIVDLCSVESAQVHLLAFEVK